MPRELLKPAARWVCRSSFWPEGAVRRILVGPSTGLRYRIFPAFGLGPIFGRWEPRLQWIMKRLVKRGDVAYDIGANYGIHTMLLARLVGDGGRVYAFEPQQRIGDACDENLRLNSFDNAEVLKLALSDQSGEVSFVTGESDAIGHIASPMEDGSTTVLCDTVDRLVTSGALRPPNFLKIDVEGHGSEVLAGALHTFSKCRPLLCIELHTPAEDVAIGRFLIDRGYAAFRQDTLEQIRRLDAGWPATDGMQGDVLAIPSEQVNKHRWLRCAS